MHQHIKRHASFLSREDRAPLVVLQANDAIVQQISAQASPMRIVVDTQPTQPWCVPMDAEVLVTRPFTGWRIAPAEPPPGWPFALRWIQTQSVGVDAYPAWLTDGVTVTVGRGVSADPISEYVLAALLRYEKELEKNRVKTAEGWRTRSLGRLTGRTLGLLGYGAVGQAIASRAAAFGMRIIALRRSPWTKPDPLVEPATDLESLISQVDHLVLALPSTGATRHIVDARILAKAKPGLHLINVARGQLIDQDALADALDSGHLGGATLDVTDPEPLHTGHRLYAMENVLITPHISWYSDLADASFSSLFIDNLGRYLRGDTLLNPWHPSRGY